MNTLLFHLVGPMQSWGSRSRFEDRDTHLEPTKSGVVGLIAAALGRDRSEPLNDLVALRMGVRVDSPGIVASDFHTAQSVARASGSGKQETVISRRHYLSDAMFLVGLESAEVDVLNNVADALANPRWLLSLGRKSFPLSLPPSGQMCTGVDLETALQMAPILRTSPRIAAPSSLRVVIESDTGDALTQDNPVSFVSRDFTLRRTTSYEVPTDRLNNIYI